MTGEPVAYVLSLWVAPSYRRQRLGTAAIQAIGEWGKKHACTAIELQVFSHNFDAQAFYRHHGFSVGGLLMQRHLNSCMD